jgi:hypothetical protein
MVQAQVGPHIVSEVLHGKRLLTTDHTADVIGVRLTYAANTHVDIAGRGLGSCAAHSANDQVVGRGAPRDCATGRIAHA